MSKPTHLLSQAITLIEGLEQKLTIPKEVLQAMESFKYHAADSHDYWSYVEDETDLKHDIKTDAIVITHWFFETFMPNSKKCFSYCNQCGNMISNKPGKNVMCKLCEQDISEHLGFRVNMP